MTEQVDPDAAESVVLAESASAKMLVVLETLTPAERAVFVLREVFDYPYEDIAGTLGRSTASVRQLAHRAREHVQSHRPRFSTNQATQRRLTRRFLDACRGGDLQALLAQLAPDVTLRTDGGGRVDSVLYKLIKICASQINGCAFCIDMHTKEARAAGESEQRIFALNAWRETPFLPNESGPRLRSLKQLPFHMRATCPMRSTTRPASISTSLNWPR